MRSVCSSFIYLTFHLISSSVLAMLGKLCNQFDHLRITFDLSFCRAFSGSPDPRRSDRHAAGCTVKNMKKSNVRLNE